MSFFRRAMDYLGLSGEEAYDDYDMSMEYERPQRVGRPAPDQGRRSNFDPEYSSETQRPAARPMRVDDTGAARRPDDSGLQVRPVGTARTSPTVRTIPTAGETVTVRPRNFNQAQEIADHFKDGVPVIVNLEGADREMSRRIIDFASGMCYALSGTMEKVGSGVYLLKPAVSFDSPRY
ncbi:MAG: cell division protein SepF [Ilumatobacteraceae bacterium]|jgi:cell division inhibitor SepF|nr:cell division protein SepF [Actinomycetota bacterium]